MRTLVALAAAIALWATGAPAAQAQGYPDDVGAGIRRGAQQVNKSGENGSITLFDRGPEGTLVVVRLDSQPHRPQPASLNRAHGCGDIIDAPLAFRLNDVVDGRSRTLVPISQERLLSGNYSAVIAAGYGAPRLLVVCGHLYR